MADENEKVEEEEGQEGAGAKTGKNKKLIFLLLGILILGGVGGGAAFFFLGGDDQPAGAPSSSEESSEGSGPSETHADDSASADDGDDAATSAAGALQKATTPSDENTFVDINFGATYKLKPFHSNLGNPLENRYLRLELAFEYKQGEEQRKEIEARLPQLRDAVLSVASRKTREFLLGPDGKGQLRLEILNRVNQFMDKKIESVFITDMLIE